MLGRLSRGDELRLRELSVGDVADRGCHQALVPTFDGTQADLNGKLRSVGALRKELQTDPHGSHARFGEIPFAVPDVPRSKSLRHERFNVLPHDVIVLIV